MHREVKAFRQPTPKRFDQRPAGGLNWRQLATVLLLVVTLPIFLTAGFAAALLLPVLLTWAAVEQLRRFVALRPARVPARQRR